MGTMNTVYIVGTSKFNTASAKLKVQFEQCRITIGKACLAAELPSDMWIAPETALKELSAELRCDVIWLGYQSTVDAFQFHRWRDGACLRALVFGCFADERTWDRVEGEAQDWERDAIFRVEVLNDLIECAATEDEREEFKRIWRERELAPNRTEPTVNAYAAAWAVMKYYRLPEV